MSSTFANHHVPRILSLNGHEGSIQYIDDGKQLRYSSFSSGTLSIHHPVLVRDTPTSIGMRVPGQISVRQVADLVGHSTPVNVLDVEYQEELEGWTFGSLVDYFEDEERVARCDNDEEPLNHRAQFRRKASEQFVEKTRHRVLNQITFEFSRTPLKDVVQSPTFVREMDWIDTVWPYTWRHERSLYPAVQLYCLTSAACSYTDFHVDFGGTSVWYHVVSGLKTFVLVEPTEAHLRIYEQWLTLKDQANTFFLDLLPKESQGNIVKVTLQPRQTFFIPSGWIHAVYTPKDSLVFGGNFLHGLDMPMQWASHQLEIRTKVPKQFLFPYFLITQLYAGSYYLQRLRSNDNFSPQELDALPYLAQIVQHIWNSTPKEAKLCSDTKVPTVANAAKHCLAINECESIKAFCDALRNGSKRLAVSGTLQKHKTRIVISSSPRPKPATMDAPVSIQLSVSSQQSNPLPVPKRREDLASFVDNTDEEWVPSTERRNKRKVKQNASNRADPKVKPAKRTTAKSTTARERLLKKLRR